MSWITLVTPIVLIALSTGTSQSRYSQSKGPQKLDASRLHLNMLVLGKVGPTVLLESGFGGIESWGKVQPEVARFARVVAYDRAGLGQSESSVNPRKSRRQLWTNET